MRIRIYRNAHTGAYEPPGPRLIGAYALNFPETGHVYYGSANDLRAQIARLLKSLANGTHDNSRLQYRFNTRALMGCDYIPTESIEEARAITREHIQRLRGTPLLCNERIPRLLSRESRAKAKRAFQTEAYKAKAGKSRTALWEDPVYRERVLTPQARAKRAAHFQRVSIDGMAYPGLTAAARALGLSRMTLHRRCKDLNYPRYFYLPPLNGQRTS